jgi:DNA-binding NarL/FixJ family response regulator
MINIKLTKREQIVMDLVVQGKLNKEIAIELGISKNTVDRHLSTIYKKLRTRNRTEAVARFTNLKKNNKKLL